MASVNYEELCTMPYGIPVDLTERRTAGVLPTALISMSPIGVPLWSASTPRMWIANGASGDGGEFRKRKRART
ncbi:MAG: hypothetical protein AAGA54_35905 [Myxococcota bacterium]